MKPGRILLVSLALLAGPARPEEAQLNIYNWADYIGADTIDQFERETGIKVVYDTYDSDSALEAKMMAGHSGYDLVTTATTFFGRQIKAGVYEELDRSKLANWKNLDPRILAAEAAFDPSNRHAVPYLHGINGFTWNVPMIKARMPDAPVDSLDMLFKPEVVSKFADCGVTLLDSAEDVLQLALSYLHRDPNSKDPADYKAAEQLLLKVRPYIRNFDSQEYMTALPNGELCLAMSWSADYETARARAKGGGVALDLAFTVPKEGANEWFDAWLIPAGAPHPEAAYKFLDFMLRPEVIARTTNEIHYGNDNAAADAFVDPALLHDPAIYPTPEIERRLYQSQVVDALTERLRSRTWTRVKTGV